jgi:hypothetical protein
MKVAGCNDDAPVTTKRVPVASVPTDEGAAFSVTKAKLIFVVDEHGNIGQHHSDIPVDGKVKAFDARPRGDGSYEYEDGTPSWYGKKAKAATETLIAETVAAMNKLGPAYAKKVALLNKNLDAKTATASKVHDTALAAADKAYKAAVATADKKEASANAAAQKAFNTAKTAAFAPIAKLGGIAK